MAGRREVGFAKANGVNLKEQLAMATLRNVRLQGHTYVDLRRDGKRSIFFCTLCLAPCYSDSILYSHLKGNLHCERLTAAKATLLKSNPWPFDDGVLFFGVTSEQDTVVSVPKHDSIQLLDNICENDDRAVVPYHESVDSSGNGHASNGEVGFRKNPGCVLAENISRTTCMQNLVDDIVSPLVIPDVLCKNGLSQLEVTCFGVAQIAARFCKKDGSLSNIRKIWCEWLGRGSYESEDTLTVLEHDFAIVTFSYNYNVGRKGLFDDIKFLLPSSPHSELEENTATMNRKRKSSSDPEDFSESLTGQYDSSGEESESSNSNKRMLLEGCDDQLLYRRVLSSKSMRRELRQQQQAASERMCDICQQKMLPSKDVAALLNRKTGKLACSSRNSTGAFHVFHVSCLIHWILLCEMESYEKQLNAPKPKRRSRRKVGSKLSEAGKTVVTKQVFSSFCPECQGTGVTIDGDQLEKPTVPLSEIFKYKIKVSDGCRAWMKSPELLPNCSTGFCFPDQSEDTLEVWYFWS
ncbi:OLC1v1023989C3 [Oldenlandia corymbosa var. corymbosa]|uniref:OLC1v1023989C3 n=1 Tax=Oldenlandia corymbosa var. corymbosa TaxID=529605 RepID=A0AAV1C184_OLDCO|nr:OLC1v1023989C3 [Oldenlandia corymbosa var. corymbosa]